MQLRFNCGLPWPGVWVTSVSSAVYVVAALRANCRSSRQPGFDQRLSGGFTFVRRVCGWADARKGVRTGVLLPTHSAKCAEWMGHPAPGGMATLISFNPPTHRDKTAMNGAQLLFSQRKVLCFDDWATCHDAGRSTQIGESP